VEEDDLAIRLMDRGWDIISIPVTPLIHLFSGIRDINKLHYLGARNAILFIFLNTPMPYLLFRIIKSTLSSFWYGILIGETMLRFSGIIDAYRLFGKLWGTRKPVSIRTWKKFRRLLKQPEPYVPV
jgi:hypothetical protein